MINVYDVLETNVQNGETKNRVKMKLSQRLMITEAGRENPQEQARPKTARMEENLIIIVRS